MKGKDDCGKANIAGTKSWGKVIKKIPFNSKNGDYGILELVILTERLPEHYRSRKLARVIFRFEILRHGGQSVKAGRYKPRQCLSAVGTFRGHSDEKPTARKTCRDGITASAPRDRVDLVVAKTDQGSEERSRA